MAAQAALIADTVAGMRRVAANHHDNSDSDNNFYASTNRGNKLKRKAQYVREGQLDMPNGPKVYKRKIEHAGHKRYIIHRNPQRYDEEGDPLDDDEVDEYADADAAARNPYHDVRLEGLLQPLTSAADLPNHPSMSIPYKSTTLPDMVQYASEVLHREQKTLWQMKHLLTKLRGDATWIPCGMLNSVDDDIMFDTEAIYHEIIESQFPSSAQTKGQTVVNGEAAVQTQSQPGTTKKSGPSISIDSDSGIGKIPGDATPAITGKDVSLDVRSGTGSDLVESAPVGSPHENREVLGLVANKEMNVDIKIELPSTADTVPNGLAVNENLAINVSHSSDPEHGPRSPYETGQSTKVGKQREQVASPDSTENRQPLDQKEVPLASSASTLLSNGEVDTGMDHGVGATETGAANEESIGADGGGDASHPVPHRMQTRAQAQAKSDKTASSRTRSASPASWNPPVVHPLFLMPASASPDRNFGLPPGEAEETRRMVTLYTQKQEEVCRSAEKLYFGLLKADRMRKTVFKWCKAEGHIGEMSDGEDWYDKEEWGLDEDLRKGQEEEEEDKDREKEATGAQAKKTRKTRVPALK